MQMLYVVFIRRKIRLGNMGVIDLVCFTKMTFAKMKRKETGDEEDIN